jgi:chromosome partitioning protein
MAKIIAMSNHKGGVAKTTSVVNIGSGLSSGKAGKRVLLIDLDPQANLTHSLGIDNPERTIYGAMRGEYPITPIKVSDRLSVVASTLDLSSAEIDLSTEAGREFVLKELIQPLKKDHDYIIIDCPPSLSLLTLNALVAADDVYIPMQTQYLALQGLTKLTDVIEKIQKRLNKKLNLSGIILTQYDSRKVLDRDISKAITNKFKDKVFNTKIRNTVALAEAPMKGVDIFRYAPKSNGAQDYTQLCKEILSRNNKK